MTDATAQPTAHAKPRRRWPRFSLRTMLLAVALLGAWLAVMANRANRQRKAVEAVNSAGGEAYYDYQANEDGFRAEGNGRPPGPAWLRNLVGIDYLATAVGVTIDTDIADDRFRAAMDGLPQLKCAVLAGSGATNATLAHIADMPHLVSLSVFNSSITDSGWENLDHASHLAQLTLQGSNVDDATLSHVNGLTDIRELRLLGSEITDAGLKHLESLRQLKMLVLGRNESLTSGGKRELQRALPQLYIDEGSE